MALDSLSINLLTNIIMFFSPRDIYCSNTMLCLLSKRFYQACKTVLPYQWTMYSHQLRDHKKILYSLDHIDAQISALRPLFKNISYADINETMAYANVPEGII